MIKIKNLKDFRSYIHPILISVYPVIFLYAENPGEISFKDILIPTAYLLAVCAYIFGSTLFFVRNIIKTSLLVSVFLIFSYSYGYIYSSISSVIDVEINHIYLVSGIGFFYLVVAYLILESKKPLNNATLVFNIFAASLILISLLKVFAIYVERVNLMSQNSVLDKVKEIPHQTIHESDNKRDIYFIIFDQYARADIMKDKYDFDNSAFITFLEDRGFYVATSSYANYPNTHKSLASSLNLEYLDDLGISKKNNSQNHLVLKELLINFKIWQYLRAQGYKYLHFGLGDNKYADISYNIFETQSNIKLILHTIYRNSLLWSTLKIFNLHRSITEDLLDGHRLLKRERILYQFEKLREIPDMDYPTFTFVHMLIPHAPYVFEADGKSVSFFQERRRSKRNNYINQLQFTNNMAMELIQKILDSSSVKPIIIIQSDEGPYPDNYMHNKVMSVPDDVLKHKYGILNAYYLPDVDNSILYPDISSVNTFRVVFNLYFGADYDLLPDRHFSYYYDDITYKFK